MSEHIDNIKKEKQLKLKNIIKKLHDGVPVDKLKKDFSLLIKDTSADEIADMENALIQEGFPVEEVQRLCDVHAEVFEEALKKEGKARKIPGHPIHTFIEENNEARKIIKNISKEIKRIMKNPDSDPNRKNFILHFENLREINKHYLRKENQLFPKLEAKNFMGPTRVMWGKHDEIRTLIKEVLYHIGKESWGSLIRPAKEMVSAIKKLMFLEEKILFPTAAKKLDENDWIEIKLGESEIGYAWVTPSNVWDANLRAIMKAPTMRTPIISKLEKVPTVNLSTGDLTTEQLNLMLKNLPVDITFVDEHDKVRYYSDTKERVFPRSPGIIGRDVQNCHPPSSIDIVNEIIKDLKEKRKPQAQFWIRRGEQLIYIRYLPVFDDFGKYRGVIEVSQEVSHIQTLKGEKRLLD